MAVETYRHATIINPNSADAHLYLGKALQQLNQETEAVAEYRKFLDLCGSNDPRAEDTRKVISELGKI
jgi:Flp pilus assembly protein TadD